MACASQGDEGRAERLQPADEIGEAGVVATDAEGLAGGLDVHVEAVLGDIDTDEDWFHDPSLRMRARDAAQATVRVRCWNRGRGTKLRRGL